MKWRLLTLCLTIAPVNAIAAPSVHSAQEVFQAEGLDHQQLTKRALVCIPKYATSGLTTADTIVTSDVDAGYVQARNAWVGDGFAALHYRSKITFEAKDGRFRITQDDFEVATDRSSYTAMNYPGSALAKMENQSRRIAACVTQGPVADDF